MCFKDKQAQAVDLATNGKLYCRWLENDVSTFYKQGANLIARACREIEPVYTPNSCNSKSWYLIFPCHISLKDATLKQAQFPLFTKCHALLETLGVITRLCRVSVFELEQSQ
jgi:hypothetical protein